MEFKVAFEAISPRSIGELAERFYDVFDGTLVERDGQIIVSVYAETQDRETPFYTALRTARELAKLDLCVVRMDQDLVDAPEIAERIGVSRQAVSLWARGDRSATFPRPLGTPGGKRIWAWTQIVDWAHGTGRLEDEPKHLSLDDMARLDAYFADRRTAVTSPEMRVSLSLLVPGSSKQGMRGTMSHDSVYWRHMTHSTTQDQYA